MFDYKNLTSMRRFLELRKSFLDHPNNELVARTEMKILKSEIESLVAVASNDFPGIFVGQNLEPLRYISGIPGNGYSFHIGSKDPHFNWIIWYSISDIPVNETRINVSRNTGDSIRPHLHNDMSYRLDAMPPAIIDESTNISSLSSVWTFGKGIYIHQAEPAGYGIKQLASVIVDRFGAVLEEKIKAKYSQ